MPDKRLTIGFARRGYSATGGAEAYLKRLARGSVDLGHQVRLITTNEWPADAWSFGEITWLSGSSAIAFADDFEKLPAQSGYDVLMSFERVWRCDVYRAGDGVHRTWLERRKQFSTPLQRLSRFLNRKHGDILRLEESLFTNRGAGRVIANSQMVKKEIVDLYDYPADKIDVVHNGVPVNEFREASTQRTQSRAVFGLAADKIAVLFVGSGWERKGLRFAVDAVEGCKNLKVRLLVAGRGNQRQYKSTRVQFLGEMVDLSALYAAADIFLLPTIYDPFSNACLEALASGLPVITTRANGFSEIIETGKHGSIVDRPDDVEELREALGYWSDEARRASARSAILERASQFDILKNVEKTLAILLQIAASAAST
jgi:UDP-glucose:(heptosyl)LPS alpha-1,3-glucosyltransferase